MSETKTPSRLFIIDTFAYIFRSYYAIRNLENNAVFGVTNTLKKLIEEENPDYLVAAFESTTPTFRKELYPDYKANRLEPPEDLVPQIPLIKRVLSAFNIPVLEKDGFESDDIIGTLAKRFASKDLQVVIVSGDKDMLQLVRDNVVMLDISKDIGYLQEEHIFEYFGCRPEQVVDLLMMWGDSSDNVPGVPGIGEKGAKKLLQEYGSIENIYQNIDTLKRKSHREGLLKMKDQMHIIRQLVTIREDVPIDIDLEECRFTSIDWAAAREIFQELNFKTFLDESEKELNDCQAEYIQVDNGEKLQKLVKRLEQTEFFVFDLETSSLDPLEAEIVGIAFALGKQEAYYIPIAHKNQKKSWKNKVLEAIKPIFTQSDALKCAHNLKFDFRVLDQLDWQLKGPWADTMLISYLLFPNENRHSLDHLAQKFLAYQMITYEQVCGSGKNQISFAEVPQEIATRYSGEDADICWQIYDKLFPRLKENDLLYVYEKVEIPLVLVLAKMEQRGIHIDCDWLAELSKKMTQKLNELEKTIHELAGEEFNIKSTQQLGKILFEKLQLPVQKKTSKTKSYSTSQDVLQKLADQGHSIPQYLLEYRELSKLQSTYIDALPKLVNSKTQRVHSNFNQVVTATGRLSSNHPNLQNIPVRTETGRQIRAAFIPQPNWRLLVADYSQIELRIMAHFSEDKTLVQAFHNNEDIHRRTASEIFDIPMENVPDELRRAAKTINFGLIYGMGGFRLAQELQISRSEANEYIESYFKKIPGVQKFRDKVIVQAKRDECVRTYLGRLRQLPEINSRNSNRERQGERFAVNTIIQGTAADLIKLAMIQLEEKLAKEKLAAQLLLQVHDELVLEAPPEEVSRVSELLQESMENVAELKVPIVAEVHEGGNWLEAK